LTRVPADPSEPLRVLYVEDAVDEALLVRTSFNEAGGYRVTHCQDGDHALELLRQKEWDLLVTDLNLPGTHGFDVIRAARAGDKAMPILAVTAYAQEHYWDQAFRSGADQVMIKPLDRDEFLSRIRTMLAAKSEDAVPRQEVILAVEGLVGDAIMGCGGTLLREMADGARVVVMPVTVDPTIVSRTEIDAIELACQMLGLELHLVEAVLGDPTGLASLVERVVQDLEPTTVYVPAIDDSHPARMDAARIAITAAPDVEPIYGYQTATTGTDFVPTRFIGIGDQMIMKSEALAVFQSLGTNRQDLRLKLLQAYAAYWGRFKDFSEVEAFEVIRGSAT